MLSQLLVPSVEAERDRLKAWLEELAGSLADGALLGKLGQSEDMVLRAPRGVIGKLRYEALGRLLRCGGARKTCPERYRG